MKFEFINFGTNIAIIIMLKKFHNFFCFWGTIIELKKCNYINEYLLTIFSMTWLKSWDMWKSKSKVAKDPFGICV